MELTPMQAAYWVGREASGRCARVSAHLYTEFDGSGLDSARLDRALLELVRTHPMLRMRITPGGHQVIQPSGETHHLKVEDFSGLSPDMAENRLMAKRRRMTHQRLALDRGECFDISLSLLPTGRQRLHIDLDMIAADPSCFPLIMDDLARLYDDPAETGPRIAPEGCYFDYLAQLAARPDREVRESRARDWWQGRLSQLPPAPPLPWRAGAETATPVTSRLSAMISPKDAAALDQLARKQRVTATALYLSVFAAALGRACDTNRFRINMPVFFREAVMRGVDNLIGDFSNLTLVGINLENAPSISTLLPQLHQELSQLLSHLDLPGVSVLRDLSRRNELIESAPVVFTSGLQAPRDGLFSARVRRVFGNLVWTVSQGPQVALDVQLARLSDGVMVNWDVRLDGLPEPWVTEFFATYVNALRHLATQPEVIARRFAEWMPAPKARPERLGPLLQAYLLGRDAHMPLGGVPMQDIRLYRGRIDKDALRQRLAAAMATHPALRRLIDPHELTVTVADNPTPNLREIDLSQLSPADAEARLAAHRHRFAATQSDLSGLPWEMLLVHLPQDEQALLLRTDAMILDGAGISQIMCRLLSRQPPEPFTEPDLSGPAGDRAADEAYWTARLAAVEDPPQLPWAMPLDGIRKADWLRESITIPKAVLRQLTRIGGASGLFRNSLLMSALLEVLSRWTPNLHLCVGVPLGLPVPGPLANRSSFIAVDYDARQGGFAERAAQLQRDVQEGTHHTSFSGIDLSRMLVSRNGGRIALPIVITNALGWDRLAPDDPVRLVDGLTQTPQVAIDLRLSLDEGGDLLLALDHVRQAVPAGLARQLLASMDQALRAICAKGGLDLEGADFLPARPGSDLIGAEYDGPGFLTRIARNLYRCNPDHPALIVEDQQWSYGELGQMVARLRGGLAQRGLTPGNTVAICLPRGIEHLATSVACSLSGLTWVPIDADSPPERLNYLLTSCRADLIVGTAPLPGHEAVLFARLPAEAVAPPDDAALESLSRDEVAGNYLYTSGTTGRPKCVVLSNRATANTIGHTLDRWQVTPDDRIMSITPLHHDMSVFDLFGTLAAGATLVMPGRAENKDAIAWNRILRQHAVTIWISVPAIVEMLLACEQGGSLGSLRLIAQGGDYIKPAVIQRLRQLLPKAELWSLGGPTETTIWSIWHQIGPADRSAIPYGRALPGNRYLILNPLAEACPIGVQGRIHTAGVNLARGYLVDGQVTQTDFVTLRTPDGEPLRAFRTGDLARIRKDGTIMFGARVNGYIKVRGVRVSSEDVAAELSHHPQVAQVLVVDVTDPVSGDIALAALVVGQGGPVPAADLRRFAASRLPQSHVPDLFVPVEALPLSANGKPDRHKARKIALTPGATHSPVLATCLEVIGRPAPAADADDGTPLLSLGLLPSHLKALAAALALQTGVGLPLPTLLRCRTAADIAASIASADQTTRPEFQEAE